MPPTPRRGHHHSGDRPRDRLGRWVAADALHAMSESDEEAVHEVPIQKRGKTVVVIDDSDEEEAKNTGADGKGHSRRARKMEKRGYVNRKQIQEEVGMSSSKKRGKRTDLEGSGQKCKQARVDDYNQGGSSEDSGYDTEELQDILDEYGDKFDQAEKMMLEDIERNPASVRKAISDGFEWLQSELLDVMLRPKKKGGKGASKK